MNSSPPFRIVTYNILHPKLALKWKTPEGIQETSTGCENNWKERKDKLIENLIRSDFSVACLQEVDYKIVTELTDKQPFRAVLLSPHAPKGMTPQEGVTIFYNHEKVDLVHKLIFKSLRGHPNGTRGELYVDVKDKISKMISRIASMHLKGYNPNEANLETKWTAMRTGLEQLITVIETVETNTDNIHEIFICGDFNEDDQEPVNSRVSYLISRGYQEDGSRSATHFSSNKKLDWIFHKSIRAPHRVMLTPFLLSDQNKASDHCLVGTDIKFL